MNTGTNILAKLTHLVLSYENGVQALTDVSLEVREGERLCILGANGSGKSTLASVICGLLAPDEGQVELLGRDVFDSTHEKPRDFAAYREARRAIGLVFQSPDDQIVTTVVEEDVAFGPENLGLSSEEIELRVRRELKRVALEAYAKADPTKLSGGQKQRVAIAGALAMEPALLVLDEPGSLLDVRGRRAILRVMDRLQKAGTTIIHVTHFMEEVVDADRVIVLDKGRVALEGTPSELFANSELVYKLGLELPFNWQLKHSWDTQTPAPLSRAVNKKRTLSCVVEGLSYSYKTDDEAPALTDVSFELARSEFCAVIGQTGSGKSTLARILSGLEAADSGRVEVLGHELTNKRERRKIHGRVGYVMQHPERQLFAETVAEDVSWGPRNMGLSQRELEERCNAALELVDLTELAHVSPFELSGGQQRLCALAGVLAMQPPLLVLDEPTAGLDPKGRASLREVLRRVQDAGTGIFMVTHSMDQAAHADKVIVLNESRIWSMGCPDEIFSFENCDDLERIGLGLPPAARWAKRLLDEAGVDLGCPLTLDALVGKLQELPPAQQRLARELSEKELSI